MMWPKEIFFPRSPHEESLFEIIFLLQSEGRFAAVEGTPYDLGHDGGEVTTLRHAVDTSGKTAPHHAIGEHPGLTQGDLTLLELHGQSSRHPWPGGTAVNLHKKGPLQ